MITPDFLGCCQAALRHLRQEAEKKKLQGGAIAPPSSPHSHFWQFPQSPNQRHV